MASFAVGIVGLTGSLVAQFTNSSDDVKYPMFFVGWICVFLLIRGFGVFLAWQRLGRGPGRKPGDHPQNPETGPKLVVVRAGGFWRDRLRTYKILVDGRLVGSVFDYDTLVIPVKPGYRHMRAKIDFFKSREILLCVDPDGTRHLVCAAGSVADMPSASGYLKLWKGQLTEAPLPAIGTC